MAAVVGWELRSTLKWVKQGLDKSGHAPAASGMTAAALYTKAVGWQRFATIHSTW